jgi:hypothetical protein
MKCPNSPNTQNDNTKVEKLKQRLAEVRGMLKDPATPRSERPRLKLQRDTYAWMLEKLDGTGTR